MVKVTLNPMFQGVQGKIGRFVLRRTRRGGLSVIKLADMSKVQWSEAQEANRQRFREAMAYAKAAMAEPRIRAIYEKEAPEQNKTRYELAISDYYKGRNLLQAQD